MKPANRIQQIFTEPAQIVPTLSNDEIKEILIEAIEGYKNDTFTFTQLVRLATKIEIYQPNNLTEEITMIIETISSYYTISHTLNDMLEELKQNL